MSEASIVTRAFSSRSSLVAINTTIGENPQFFVDYPVLNLKMRTDRWPTSKLQDMFDDQPEAHIKAFEEIAAQNLKVKLSMCSFAQQSVPLPGHIVDKNEVHRDPLKVDAIFKFNTLISQTELRSCLELAGYHRLSMIRRKVCSASCSDFH